MRKRLLAILTCMVMVLTMVPAVTAYGNSDTSEVSVMSNGGTVTIDGEENTSQWGMPVVQGSTLRSVVSELSVDYWTDRGFAGWQICKWGLVPDPGDPSQMVEDWVPITDRLYTTKELMDYEIPSYDIAAIAQWEGNDSDYYSLINFDCWGGKMDMHYEGDQTYQNDGWADYLKITDLTEDGLVIGEQLAAKGISIENDPVKSGANFEGWLKYYKTEKNGVVNYQLASETPFTTAQVMNQRVTDSDVSYAAKWSNLNLNDYWVAGIVQIKVNVDANGGMLILDRDDGQEEITSRFDYAEEGNLLRDIWDNIDAYRADGTPLVGWKVFSANTGEEITGTVSPSAIMDFEIPDYDVNIVAQWTGTVDDEEDSDRIPTLEIDLNGGTATIDDDPEAESQHIEIPADAKTVGDAISIEEDTIKYWDGERNFEGWNIYKIDIIYDEWGDEEHRPVLLEEDLSTSAMLEYQLKKNTSLYIKAVWAGDDSDYMTTVIFDGFEGSWNVLYGEEEYVSNWDNFELREDGSTVREQIENYHNYKMTSDPAINDPDRPNAEFEGWLVYKVTTSVVNGIVISENYELISEELYTTDEIMNAPVPEDDTMYAAKWADLSMDDYEMSGSDPNYLEVEFWYYDETGEYVCKPIRMRVDGESTFGEMLDKMAAKIQHMEGLTFTGWKYGGNWDNSLKDEIAVGMWMNAAATYEQDGVVMTEINYLDPEGEAKTIYKPVIFEEGDLFQDVYLAVEPDLPTAHHAASGWTGNWDIDVDLSEAIPCDMPGMYMCIYAEYSTYEIELAYTYLTKDGETKTVSNTVTLNADESIRDYYRNLQLPEDAKIPTAGVTWAVNGRGYLPDYPTLYDSYFHAAVNYDDSTAVFVNRAVVNEECEPEEIYDEAYYVTADFDKQILFKEELAAAVTARDTESYADFDLKGYTFCYNDYFYSKEPKYPEDFIETYGAYLQADYDKALVYIEKNDGTYEKIVKDAGSTYALPAIDNYHEVVWDIGAPFRGGMARGSNQTVTVASPYITAHCAYKVEISELTSVPEGIDKSLGAVKREMKEASIEEGIDGSKIVIGYMDVELQEKGWDYSTEQETWDKVDEYDFPEDGLVLYLPYPEGTSPETHDFTVTHMFNTMADSGKVEVLAAEETEHGLKVTVTSLSPIAIAYEGDEATPSGPDLFEEEDQVRLAGTNRFETSAEISKGLIADDAAEAIVLVDGQNFPDALAAAPFASSVGAPILMTVGSEGVIPDDVKAEIERIDSDYNADIYIVGGTGAVSDQAIASLHEMGYDADSITRVAGTNRYLTAVEVAKETSKNMDVDTVFIANGHSFPDALGGGSAAALNNGVILFTAADVLNGDTKEYIEKEGIENVVILGGTGAVSEKVENELKGMCDNVSRQAGLNRYNTGLEIAKKYFPKTDTILIATGNDFADALAGGPLAAYQDAPLLLINSGWTEISPEMKEYIRSSGATNIAVLGGTGAVSKQLYDDLYSLIK